MRIHRRDDQGSLAIAMLVMIAGVGISAVMLGSTMQLIYGTRLETARTVALQNARAGISAVLSNLRSASVTSSQGVVTAVVEDLPCTTLSGRSASGTSGYTVKVSYLTEDPYGHSSAWISANGKPCATDVTGGVPAFAYVESVGTDKLTGDTRTLFGIYAFRRVTDGKVVGGQIRALKNNNDKNTLCLDAGGGLAPNVPLTMATCATDPDGKAIARQRFGYQPNITITLVQADKSLYPNGLCVDAGSTQKVKNVLMLQECGAKTKIQQEWSYNYASGFFGTSDGVTINNFCWSVAKPDTPGSKILLNDDKGGNGKSACNTDYPNNFQSWNTQPDVGPGGAGADNLQVVNYEQFGRCLDVTYEDVTKPFEVAFQCKESPTADPVNNWNQTWHLPPLGTGPVYTIRDSDKKAYCLTMPAVNANPKLVVVKACLPSLPVAANQTWWVRGAATATPAEKFRIEGVGAWDGLCLAPMPDQPAFLQADKIGLQSCSDSEYQKWNYVPSASQAGLTSIGER
jgi:hypothetical protein